MIRPTLEEAMQYQKDYKVVPVLKEIYSDICTPMQVLKILKKASKHCYIVAQNSALRYAVSVNNISKKQTLLKDALYSITHPVF